MKIFIAGQVCLVLFFMALTIDSYAGADTLVYHVYEVFNVNNNEALTEDSEMLIDSTNEVVTWVNGNRRFDFSILETNATENGATTYRVRRKNYEGKIVVATLPEGTEIRMEFMNDGVNTMPFVFKVDETKSR